ncbi:hypothetical protein SEUCBS139899_002060 [Sporothrix eucalyptigena]
MWTSLRLSKSIVIDGVAVRPHTTKVNLLAVAVGGCGGFSFGYANSAMAGSFAQPTFIAKFLSGSNATNITTALIGVFLGAGFIGSLLQAFTSQRWGRRPTAAGAALWLAISGALQAGSVNTAMLIVSRAICGISVGMALANCPVYMSEVSPAHVRGMLTGGSGVTLTIAYVIASCLSLSFSYIEQSYAWRLQFVVLAAFGLFFFVAVLFIPESPRWLVEQERYDEAWAVLRKLHQSSKDSNDLWVYAEMRQIRAQIESERSQQTGFRYIATNPSMRKRALCSILVWLMAQSTGVIVISSFTPTLFGQLGYGTIMQFGLSIAWTVTSLLAGCCNAYLMERLGRIKLFIFGGSLCTACLIVEGVLQKYYLYDTTDIAGTKAAVAMYFIFVIGYGGSVECGAYAYSIEIWPTHLRSRGGTIALSTLFLTTCAYGTAATAAFESIGWKYYIVMACICIACVSIIPFYCPETKGLTLEEIGAKFGDHVEVTFDEAVEKAAISHNVPVVSQVEVA